MKDPEIEEIVEKVNEEFGEDILEVAGIVQNVSSKNIMGYCVAWNGWHVLVCCYFQVGRQD